MESDTEEEEILVVREAVPLRIRIPGARNRPPAVSIPAPIDPGMWLSMVNVEPPHLSDLEIENSTMSTTIATESSSLFWRSSSTLSVTKMAEKSKRSLN